MRRYRAVRHFIRRSWLALLAVTSVLTLGACDTGPRQAGAAAVVGNTQISVDSLQREFNWLLKNVPEAEQLRAEKALGRITSNSLAARIRHELITDTAARLGLRADPGEVDTLLGRLGGETEAAKRLLTTPGLARERIEDMLLLRAIGDHYVDRLSVRVTGTLISQEEPGSSARQRAVELGKRMAATPGAAAELAERGDQRLPDELTLSELIGTDREVLAQTPLFSVEPGTVVVMRPSPQNGSLWLVALVEDRTETQGDSDRSYPDEVLAQIGLQMLRPAAERLGVTVSPRYGVWDEAGMVILNDEEHAQNHLFQANGAERQ